MITILRRFGLAICTAVLGIALIGLAWAYTLSATVRNQDTVKGWFEDSGFYSKTAGILLEHFAEDAEQPGLAAVASNSEVQRIANNAFGSDFLRGTAESAIGAIYAWLEGDVDTPEFHINIQDAGQRLAAGMGNFATQRAASLPACTASQLSELGEEFDALSASCLPATVTPEQAGALVTGQLQTGFNDPALANFNSNDIWNNSESGQPWPKEASQAYQRSRWAPHILALIVVIATLGTVFISANKRKGLMRAAFIYIVSGIVIGISALILGQGPGWVDRATSQIEENRLWGELILQFIGTAGRSMSVWLWWFAAGYIVIGILTIMITKIMSRQSTDRPRSQPLEPVPPIDDSPKQPTADTTHPTTPRPQASQPARKKVPRKIQL